jgi:hypothetical protein
MSAILRRLYRIGPVLLLPIASVNLLAAVISSPGWHENWWWIGPFCTLVTLLMLWHIALIATEAPARRRWRYALYAIANIPGFFIVAWVIVFPVGRIFGYPFAL